MPSQDYAFEDFPRKNLVIASSRRQLFADLVMQVRVMEGESRGGVGVRLSKLGALSNCELAPFVPQVRPDCQISTTADAVWARLPDEAHPVQLFVRDPATLCAFNSMNGRTRLSAVGEHLAETLGWTPARGFAYARGVFLHLVQLRVGVIADPGGQ
jgi:hypothetical protein